MSKRQLRRRLVSELKALVDADILTADAQLTDVFFAYRLLLGRKPPFWGGEVCEGVTHPSLRDFVRELLESYEFRQHWPEVVLPPSVQRTILTERPDGLRFHFSVSDWSIGWQVAMGCFEPDVREALADAVRPGAVCLDIGANLGFFAVVMARAGAAKVYALEPFPAAFELLARNVRENRCFDSIVALQKAADCVPGPAAIYYRPNSRNPGAMFVPARAECETTRERVSLPVERVRLDDVVTEEECVSVVKIDVEGGEFRVLGGMPRILERDRPMMVVEFNSWCLRHSGEVDPRALLDELRRYHYRVRRTDSPDVDFDWNPGHGEAVVNLLCTPADR